MPSGLQNAKGAVVTPDCGSCRLSNGSAEVMLLPKRNSIILVFEPLIGFVPRPLGCIEEGGVIVSLVGKGNFLLFKENYTFFQIIWFYCVPRVASGCILIDEIDFRSDVSVLVDDSLCRGQ